MLLIVLCAVRSMTNRTAVTIDLPDCVACGKPHKKAEIQKLLMPIQSDGVIFNWTYVYTRPGFEGVLGKSEITVQVYLTEEDIEKYWPDGFL